MQATQNDAWVLERRSVIEKLAAKAFFADRQIATRKEFIKYLCPTLGNIDREIACGSINNLLAAGVLEARNHQYLRLKA